MPTLTARSRFSLSPAAMLAWHARPGAFERLSPPWVDVRVRERPAALRAGESFILDLGLGPLHRAWHGRLTRVDAGGFTDDLVRGPLPAWRHDHCFFPDGAGCRLEDRVTFTMPGGQVGAHVAGTYIRRQMERMFAWRHMRLRADLAVPETPPLGARVAISGASGVIGAPLADMLTTRGHTVLRLVRRPPATPDEVFWQPGAGSRGGQIDPAALEGVDAVVHLAGESISRGRWTAAKKERIRESRLAGTRLICQTIANLSRRPRVLLAASGTGYYGDRGDQELHEDAGVGSGFLAEVARDWEAAVEPAVQAGVRVVNLRIGVVLAARGGLLPAMLPWYRLGLGLVPGTGRQWWPWVGLDDTVNAILHAMNADDLRGPLNVVSPAPAVAADVCAALAKALDRPLLMHAPDWAMRAAAGEKADAVFASARAAPDRLRQSGFRFTHPGLDAALRWELGLVTPAEAGVGMEWT